MDVTNATRPTVPECRSPDPDWHFGHARAQPAPCQPEAVPTMRGDTPHSRECGKHLVPRAVAAGWRSALHGDHAASPQTRAARGHARRPASRTRPRASAPSKHGSLQKKGARRRWGWGARGAGRGSGAGGSTGGREGKRGSGEHGGPGAEAGLEHRPLLLTHGRREPPGSARREQHAEGWCQFKCIEHQKNAPDQGFRLVQHISTQPN